MESLYTWVVLRLVDAMAQKGVFIMLCYYIVIYHVTYAQFIDLLIVTMLLMTVIYNFFFIFFFF